MTAIPESQALARRLAMLRVAAGVPALILSLFGVVLAFRMTGHTLGDWSFWAVLLGILVGFGVYFAYALWGLRAAARSRPPGDTQKGEDP